MTESPVTWSRLDSVLADIPSGTTVSVAVRDLAGNHRYDRAGDRQVPAASTIKLLILAALVRAVEDDQVSLTTLVPVLPSQRSAGSGILNDLTTPIELALADHARLMITISDNTASNVLIDAVGEPAIATITHDLGLTGTALNRRFTGQRPAPGAPENYTTANDLVTILASLVADSGVSPDLTAWVAETLAGQHYLDRLPRFLPPGVSFAGKSGSLEGIVHDSGVLTFGGTSVAVAVLTEGFEDTYAADDLIGRVGTAIVEDLAYVREPGTACTPLLPKLDAG